MIIRTLNTYKPPFIKNLQILRLTNMFADNMILHRAKIRDRSESILKTRILIGVELVVTLAYVQFSQEVYAGKIMSYA
ncbi:MAG: hypothetical protein ACFFCW_07520 [Candidatus Hodarchaeota archaeon]